MNHSLSLKKRALKDGRAVGQKLLFVYQPVTEHSETFMDPESEKRLFGILVVFVAPQQSLEDFRNIPEIEHIMYFGQRWKHPLANIRVQVNGCICDFMSDHFDFLCKLD